jgi:hypothetical protein
MEYLLLVRVPPRTDFPTTMVQGPPKTDLPTTMVQALVVRAPPKTDVPDYDGASTYGASPAEDRFARLRWCNS